MTEYEKLTRNFTDKEKSYVYSSFQNFEDLQNFCLERLLWIPQLKEGQVHKKVMEPLGMDLSTKTTLKQKRL